MTIGCAMCQARPTPCLRLVLPQKQLLCPQCSLKETGQSSVGRSRPELCGVTRTCCAALGGIEDGGAVSQGTWGLPAVECPVERSPLASKSSPGRSSLGCSPAGLRTADVCPQLPGAWLLVSAALGALNRLLSGGEQRTLWCPGQTLFPTEGADSCAEIPLPGSAAGTHCGHSVGPCGDGHAR